VVRIDAAGPLGPRLQMDATAGHPKKPVAGVVRKKLGLDLSSEKGDGDRVYRIVQRRTNPHLACG
jgi:hypothetical protein